MRRPGSASSCTRHCDSNERAHRVVGNVAIAREFVRERAHVARALHVVLAAQRIHADAVAADMAGCHREVREPHHHRAALAVFGDAEAVIDRRVARGRIEARRAAQFLGRYAGEATRPLRANVSSAGDERPPALERLALASRRDERLVDQPFGDDDVRERVDQRDVRAGPQLQMMPRLDVRAPHEIDAARIGDDQLRAFAQTSLEPRREHRMCVGRIGADHDDDVGVIDRLEVLRAGRRAERLLESVAGRRMTNARARVDVVVAERRADHLLHDEHFLVRAARRRNAADRVTAVFVRESRGSRCAAKPIASSHDRFAPRHRRCVRAPAVSARGRGASRNPTRSVPSRTSDRDSRRRPDRATCGSTDRP